jgi:O-antigen/teichoic acid export membrane protein
MRQAPALSRNVVASVVNAGAAVATSLISVPLILHAVGTAGYGVWTLGLAFILYASILETGLGPSVQRFTAFARGRGDVSELGRLVWTTFALYAAGGVICAATLYLVAPALVGLFDLPAALVADAETMFRLLGPALAVTLLSAGAGALVQGLERFGALALSSALGALTSLAGVVLLAESEGLPGLAYSVMFGQAVTFLVRLWSLRGSGAPARPALLSRGEMRQMVAFSARLQVTVLSELINWQSDKVVVGLVAPAATVGQLGIGAQFADGGRLLAGAALSPIHATFAVHAGAGDEAGLTRLFGELHRLWVLGVLGAAVIGASSLHPLIAGWLGPGYGEAAILGTFLVLGSAAGLATGTGVAYLRAIGRPEREARYGLIVVAVNLALTIPLALLAGARGVVIGTLGAYLIGSTWFFAGLRKEVPVSPVYSVGEAVNALLGALAAGALSFGLGVAAVAVLPTGVALPFAAAAALLAMACYAALVLGLRPTPANLRRWLASAPA